MAKPRVLVIGSTNIDMVVETPHLPAPGETVLGGVFRMSPGGKGANQAVAAARAGGAVIFISAVGDDTLGTESRARFVREGIDISHLVTKAGAPTGVALILLDAQGENSIAVACGANGQLQPDNLVSAATAFVDTRLLLMQLEIPLESVQWAARYASRLGCPVMLNPAPMPVDGLPDELLEHVSILTPNAGELMTLVPGATSLADAARQVLARGPRMLVVTRGGDGATVFTRNETLSAPAFPVSPVDTVGAGDCFSATLGVALAEGQPLAHAIRFASAAAAMSTTLVGAQAAMPTRAAIDGFLAAHNG